MDDRELLELAAKAAGYSVRWHEIWKCFVHSKPHNITNPPSPAGDRHVWVPLDDDGDAFRLAVKLGMGVNFSQYDAFTNVYPEGFNQRANTISERTSDPSRLAEISRRAIVRSAAEIGRSTP